MTVGMKGYYGQNNELFDYDRKHEKRYGQKKK